MADLTKETQSRTDFRRNFGGLMKQLKKSKRPITITAKGKPEAVVQDASGYQRLLDSAALGDVREGLRQAEEELKLGLDRDFDEFVAEFKQRRGLPR
jgi:prevent-host-death family protein